MIFSTAKDAKGLRKERKIKRLHRSLEFVIRASKSNQGTVCKTAPAGLQKIKRLPVGSLCLFLLFFPLWGN